ncbi:hypothetical protein AVDCRST_MAG82-3665 [uncultured Rubrobacteraceae bacterium]|uniref:NAD-dependent epimerase/dehydratase domain-containing protein n=1 Tax=uncultured Rubrobacteraceae bacterium TaxID=349277 RepID=A0A6J4QW36_9ACTN|nr:hypothetical protein AVDCRST_MAG82-3665 [uncultured Rubrobacteraceae bacterium]
MLGGGGFLGFHAVAEALAQGHEVTTFSREGEVPLGGVEALGGDRRSDLSALWGRGWDAVLDTFSDPEAVGETARLLSGSVGAYGFVSGVSVYHPEGPAVANEGSPLRRPEDPTISEDDPLQERSIAKLRCEGAVREQFRGPTLVVRPGIMVGPRDPTDRFTWWPVRLRAALAGEVGEEVLAPGDPTRPVQFTDARDLAAWMAGMLDAAEEGTFNAVGPGRPVTVSEVLHSCLQAAAISTDAEDGQQVRMGWAGEDFLREGLVGVPEEERPLWFPEDQIPFRAVDSSKAAEAGLSFRPVDETALDTLAWARSNPREGGLRAGFSREVESDLLRRWRKRSQNTENTR